MPAASNATVPGSGWGCQALRPVGRGVGSGERSNSTVARSTPAIPSISEWWVLVISAKRLSSSPSISHISHSGFERSSCWEKMRAVRSCSCSIPPGAGRALWRTWYSRLKSGSSTHTGRPLSTAVWASLWR